MKRKVFASVTALILAVALFSTAPVKAQGGAAGAQAPPKISDAEANLAEKINSAPDAAAKLKVAAELIKKHPKTAIRGQVAQGIADSIQEVKDPTQKLALAQEFQTLFNDPADEEAVAPIVIDAYADANQPDPAFAKGSDFLTRHPESLRVLVQLLAIGSAEAKKQNAKFLDQSIKYATQVIALAEADKKPANVDDAGWQKFKTQTLPSVYQSLGLLYVSKGSRTEAKAQYTKASQLAPSDPFNFVMLAALLNDEYQSAVTAQRALPSGAAKDAQFKKVQELLDAVIDAYARAVAVSEGNASLQQLRQQYLEDLAMYYKYRHNNSADGMQQLIDKYKVPAKP